MVCAVNVMCTGRTDFKILHKTPLALLKTLLKLHIISNSNVQIKPLSWFQLGKWEITKRAVLHNQHEMAYLILHDAFVLFSITQRHFD